MSLASFSETSWLVYSSALRLIAIVSSKSSFNSRVRLLFSPFFLQRVAVWFRRVIIRVGVWVRQFLNSWPSANRARVSCIKLIDWDTDNMLSLSFNSVDSNKSLAFAEVTGIVLRTELFTWSSQRSVSSPSLSNSALNPALSGLTLSDGWYRPAVTLNSGFGMNLSGPSLVVVYSS